MIRVEDLGSSVGVDIYRIRFYPRTADKADPFARYTAVCAADVELYDRKAHLIGMCGKVALHNLIDLARLFHTWGIERVHAERVLRHRLPLFEVDEQGNYSTAIADWIERYGALDEYTKTQ